MRLVGFLFVVGVGFTVPAGFACCGCISKGYSSRVYRSFEMRGRYCGYGVGYILRCRLRSVYLLSFESICG